MNFKKTVLVASALCAIPALQAQVTENYSFSPNLAIPDGNATGVKDVQTISSSIASIADITVSLNITGDFNGDLAVYLRHDSGFTVLLNRVGVTGVNSFGYDDHGFDVTFRNDAAHDIHSYRDFSTTTAGAQVVGLWQPDARDGSPVTGSRTATLISFQGINPNGDWTLFAADLQNGGSTSQVASWGMQITAVPEPQSIALVAGAGLLGFALWRRKVLYRPAAGRRAPGTLE
ncbi:MAG: peptidase and in kexin sedolisin [Verrucomicrobiales bacterium]|nr:peptidase and in kexin sedolisin [Verrucomicrobiales bacterium]